MVLLLLLFRPKLEDMNAGGIEVECISSFFSRLFLSFRCSLVNLISIVINFHNHEIIIYKFLIHKGLCSKASNHREVRDVLGIWDINKMQMFSILTRVLALRPNVKLPFLLGSW